MKWTARPGCMEGMAGAGLPVEHSALGGHQVLDGQAVGDACSVGWLDGMCGSSRHAAEAGVCANLMPEQCSIGVHDGLR